MGFCASSRAESFSDEAQAAPDLFSYIQVRVDEERGRPGQFVLTGSQNFLLLRQISQSLAGRCAILHLLPFSRSELLRQELVAIAEIDQIATRHPPDSCANLFEVLLAGGYPRIHDLGLDAQAWLASYYQTYVERDVREVLNVGDLETFGRFIGLCAARGAVAESVVFGE